MNTPKFSLAPEPPPPDEDEAAYQLWKKDLVKGCRIVKWIATALLLLAPFIFGIAGVVVMGAIWLFLMLKRDTPTREEWEENRAERDKYFPPKQKGPWA